MLTSTLDFPRFWLSGWVGVKEEIGSDMVVLLPFFEGDLDLSVSESVSEWSRLRFCLVGLKIWVGVVALPLGRLSGRSAVVERPREREREEFKKAWRVLC